MITPSYNQGEFLGRTLASVASQSHGAHEHLVFDGGSSDATLDVLRLAGAGVHWVSRPDRGQAVWAGSWSRPGASSRTF